VNRNVFFLPNVVGGVSSVINNILGFTPQLKGTNVIAYSDSRDQRKKIDNFNENAVISRFTYHSIDNIYYTTRRMFAFAPADLSCIVATDILELIMVQRMRIEKPVVYIVMGDFKHYYDTAVVHGGVVDIFVAISKEIYDKLVDLLPHRKKDIRLAYFPTPEIKIKRQRTDSPFLRIIYVSRLEDVKNPLMLPLIDGILKGKGIGVEWTIVGDGPLRADLEKAIGDAPNFKLTGFLSSAGLAQAYTRHDIFLLPSANEGIPVSLIEAMKTGLVPVVSDITGGIREIVEDDRNGWLCPPDDATAFAARIERLHHDRSLVENISSNAIRYAEKLFDPRACSTLYWNIIDEASRSERPKVYNPAKPGFLDRNWLPNKVVRFIRNLT
jgi:glycosyltransferase involved in cell wall biosynthesis